MSSEQLKDAVEKTVVAPKKKAAKKVVAKKVVKKVAKAPKHFFGLFIEGEGRAILLKNALSVVKIENTEGHSEKQIKAAPASYLTKAEALKAKAVILKALKI